MNMDKLRDLSDKIKFCIEPVSLRKTVSDTFFAVVSFLEGAAEDRKRMKSDIEDLKRRVRQIESDKARC